MVARSFSNRDAGPLDRYQEIGYQLPVTKALWGPRETLSLEYFGFAQGRTP
jgi:hypothetical protein